MTTTCTVRDVAGQLRNLRRVADLPVDDPERQAWLDRKRRILEQIAAGPDRRVTSP